MTSLPQAFTSDVMHIPLDRLLPSRRLPDSVMTSTKFKQVVSSIRQVGIIEPLSISVADEKTERYLVLDGHVRVLALKELETAKAPCLLAMDDEAYTYNTRINRLSTIQESRMLQEAVARGVSKEQLAQTLNIDITNVMKKLKLLDGICHEAVELLKDRQFSSEISRNLRKMKATRQVECIELMLSANSLTATYAEALYAATPAEMLVKESKADLKGVSAEQMARMEREMASIHGQYKLIEETYSDDVLNLVLAQGYLSKLLANASVKRFLKQQRPDILEQFETIVGITTLDQ